MPLASKKLDVHNAFFGLSFLQMQPYAFGLQTGGSGGIGRRYLKRVQRSSYIF